MKRSGGAFVFFMVLAALLMSFGTAAQALSADDVVCFTVDGCIPENDYIFMLLEQGTGVGAIRNSGILYIDQLTATGESLEVAVVYPGFTECDVAVGGNFSDGASSPRHLGTYTASRFPDNLNEIGEEAFLASGVTHVYLSEQVTVIGPRAFADCSRLAYIYIPASVTEIASDAFAGCGDMVIGCAEGSEAQRFAQANGIGLKVLE